MARTEPLLNCNDVAAAKKFYSSLGFETLNTWEPDGKLAWCLIEFKGAPLMLQQAKDVKVGGADVEIYIVCEDIVEIREQWLKKGIKVSKIHDAFYGMRQMFVRDPDGRVICFESVNRESQ